MTMVFVTVRLLLVRTNYSYFDIYRYGIISRGCCSKNKPNPIYN